MESALFDEAEGLCKALENWREISLPGLVGTPGERDLLGRLPGIGAASVPQLARLRGVSRQSVQVQIDALVERGWVKRSENPAHKRSPLFSLNERGRAILASVRAEERSAIDRLRAGTSDQSVRDAVQVLSAWKDAILADTRARRTEDGSS